MSFCQIRPASPTDIPALTQLLCQGFYNQVTQSPLSRWLYPLLQWTICLDLTNRLTNSDADSICLVAIHPQTQQPIATLELHFRYLHPFWRSPHKSAYLASLTVSNQWRRRGIAAQLIDHAATLAKGKGYQQIYLHVLTSNQAAQALYHKLNFGISRSDSNFLVKFLHLPQRLMLEKHLVE
ncbi:MAG: GNAT family N-acetyltransferase [Pseudanabaenaceae cyanobacterium bins.68]|nr:GNAT family N-acetyltransferase [Pseudanabaenaceae cyanobacterium bins.68]